MHVYATNTPPETATNSTTTLLNNLFDNSVPQSLRYDLWSGEGSWGGILINGNKNAWTNAYARAGFIPRYFATLWSNGVKRAYWYGYDYNNEDVLGTGNPNAGASGNLFIPNSKANPGPGKPAGVLAQPEATAYSLTNTWLVGAVPLKSQFCQNTTLPDNTTAIHCDFTESNGTTTASLVWDASASAAAENDPTNGCKGIRCSISGGTGSYKPNAPPSGFKWVCTDLSGGACSPGFNSTGAITVGANPILLEQVPSN